MKAIISGGTGSIGVALINKLISEGCEVTVLTRKESKRNYNIPKGENVKIEYCSLDEMKSFDEHIEGDVFYHLAWNGTTGTDRIDADKQLKNIEYTLDAVRLANRAGCKTFIGVGSQAEYGRVEEKLNSKTPTNPENGYGIAKLCAGQMSRMLAHQLEMKHIWTRILSVYGPYDGAGSMVMSTITKLQNGESPQMTKGEQYWDYLYSDDAAEALYLLWEKGKDGQTYCIGSGIGKPLREYVEIMRELVNPKVEIEYGAVPYADKQVMYLCADIRDLQRDTGFSPKTNFETGIKLIIEAN